MGKRVLVFCMVLSIVISSINISIVFAENDIEREKVVVQETPKSENYDEYIDAFDGASYSNGNIITKGINFEEIIGAEVQVITSLGTEQYEALQWTNESGSVNWNIVVNETGLYVFELMYYTLSGRDQPIEIGLLIDNDYPFTQCQSLSFPRYWKDNGGLRTDNKGNEFSPEQIEVSGWYTNPAKDISGRFSKPFLFYLESGVHTVTLRSIAEPLAIGSICFSSPIQTEDYASFQSGINKNEYYDGDPVIAEGEDAYLKSKNSLVSQSDSTSAVATPSDAYINKINYIGGGNWSQPGDTIEWEVDIPKPGYYIIGFKYRQKYMLNATFYRNLKINGKTVFTEAEQLSFPYSRSWSYMEAADENKNPYLFYFDNQGTHRISMEVTLGPMADICNRLDDAVYNLGSLYRSIVMITGETPDANRDYNLFTQIPDFEDQLRNNINSLSEIAADMGRIMGDKSTTAISVVNNIENVLELMRDNKYSAHRYKNRYYSTYASFSAWLNEIGNMPLDIDRIILYGSHPPVSPG